MTEKEIYDLLFANLGFKPNPMIEKEMMAASARCPSGDKHFGTIVGLIKASKVIAERVKASAPSK